MHVFDFFRFCAEDARALSLVASECLDFSSERHLDVLMVLSFCEGVRQVAVLRVPNGPAALPAAEFDRLVQALVDARPSLQLVPLCIPPALGADTVAVDCTRLFSQGAATASRKQIVPIWNACIEAAGVDGPAT